MRNEWALKSPKGDFNTNPPSPLFKGGIAVKHLGIRFGFVLFLLMLLSSCAQRREEKPDTSKGAMTHIDSITVYCDEGFRYLMDQEIRIYEYEQPDQHIHIEYRSENEVLKAMMTDTFSSAILGRKLTEKENKELFHNSNLQVTERGFAMDAVAIIANPNLDRDTISYDALLSLLTNSSHQYNLVFEGNGSGVINYMFSQIVHSAVHPSAFAAKNTDELVDYLQKDTKAIGFIPFMRISDEDDRSARELLKKVKLMRVSKPDSTGKLVVSTASQSEIADGSYPFDRPINFISHSMNDRVGTGFVNFLNRDQSGRIILKSGLVPFIMPQRLINVKTDGIK